MGTLNRAKKQSEAEAKSQVTKARLMMEKELEAHIVETSHKLVEKRYVCQSVMKERPRLTHVEPKSWRRRKRGWPPRWKKLKRVSRKPEKHYRYHAMS